MFCAANIRDLCRPIVWSYAPAGDAEWNSVGVRAFGIGASGETIARANQTYELNHRLGWRADKSHHLAFALSSREIHYSQCRTIILVLIVSRSMLRRSGANVANRSQDS